MMQSQRHLFDIPQDIAYFNCAYNSPQLRSSQARLQIGVASKSHPWERSAASFFDDAELIRVLSSQVFGGDSDGYAIIPAASYGISTAARAIEPTLQTGDEILLVAEEFPSNVLPWKRVAFERGAHLVTVPTPANGNWTQAIVDMISSKVKVLALSTCHWTNGAFIDLLAIRRYCSHLNITLVVDATQSLGAMEFDLEQVKPDFLVAAGYKWLLCPYGFGLLYVAPQWRNARPLEETWLARENAHDFAKLVNYSEVYLPGARRFDVGEKCTASILPGAIAALEQLHVWGVSQISDSIALINQQIASRLLELGFHLPDESLRCPHLFGALIPSSFNGNLVSELKERKIFVSQRGNAIRFAPHLHVSDYDVERLLCVLSDLVL